MTPSGASATIHGTEFSNLEGIQQIRFDRNNIRAAFGEVLATIRREFGPQ
jgi:hypothetical protein